MSEQIVEEIPSPTTFLVARNQAEMQTARVGLENWLTVKIAAEKLDLREIEAIVKHARLRKWKTRPLESRAARQKKRILFYEKCYQACAQGYTLIPNFPIDVMAVRTKKQSPNEYREATYFPDLSAKEGTENLAASEGHYVAPRPTEKRESHTVEKDGKNVLMRSVEAVDFTDPEFPLAVATPLIMDATAQSLAEKLFDEIGVCPPRRRGDPIVVGKIVHREGYSRREMSFLIAWGVDVRTL